MPGQRDDDLQLREFARQLRKSATDSERKLWRLLRGRQLSQYKFRRQVPLAGYIVDFYCVKAKVVIELDGGQHLEPDALKYDVQRTAVLNKLGIRVLRFGDRDVLKHPDSVCATLIRDMAEMPSPRPSPGVPGEGEEGANISYVRSPTSLS